MFTLIAISRDMVLSFVPKVIPHKPKLVRVGWVESKFNYFIYPYKTVRILLDIKIAPLWKFRIQAS